MSIEERYNFLLAASKAVLKSFRGGSNPTFEQLDKLELAIYSMEIERVCGHKEIEECECNAKD